MSDHGQIEVLVHTSGDATILRPRGEVDLSSAGSLRRRIGEAQAVRPPRLIIDLVDVPYMDSSGVATLVEAMQVARRTGGKLILCCLREKVRSVFEIARLDMVFTIVDSPDEAMAI